MNGFFIPGKASSIAHISKQRKTARIGDGGRIGPFLVQGRKCCQHFIEVVPRRDQELFWVNGNVEKEPDAEAGFKGFNCLKKWLVRAT
jgi:hypothetical protein